MRTVLLHKPRAECFWCGRNLRTVLNHPAQLRGGITDLLLMVAQRAFASAPLRR